MAEEEDDSILDTCAVTSLKISVHNQETKVNSGEEIRGAVTFLLTWKRFIQVTLECRGLGQCRIERSTGIGRDTKYDTREIQIFSTTKTITYDHRLGDYMEMPKGEHTLPFAIRLPRDIPSSYHDEFASIRYELVATEKSEFLRTGSRDLTVAESIDTNVLPHCRPVEVEEMAYAVKNWCCSGGQVSFSVRLERSAFCPGETIHLAVRGNNRSQTILEKTIVRLIRSVTYRTWFEDKTTTKTLSLTKSPPFHYGTFEWNDGVLFVPNDTSPSITYSRLLEVSYHIHVVVIAQNMSLDLQETLPVTIATIPFREPHLTTGLSLPSSAPDLVVPSAPDPVMPSAPDPVMPSAPEDERPTAVHQMTPVPAASLLGPPPSYEEIVRAD